MLRVVGLSLLLLGVAWLGCRFDRSARSEAPLNSQDEWVLTTDGWESKRDWEKPANLAPRFHPAILALGQTFVSIMALIAYCPAAAAAASDLSSHKKSSRRFSQPSRDRSSNSTRTIVAVYR